MAKSLTSVRHLALDMDGTIYSGGTLFADTLPFLGRLKDLGVGHTFLTNNSSRSSVEPSRVVAVAGIARPSSFITWRAASAWAAGGDSCGARRRKASRQVPA